VNRPPLENTGTDVLFVESKVDFSLLQRNQTKPLFPPFSSLGDSIGSFVVGKVTGT
jgi:hypothetical protein